MHRHHCSQTSRRDKTIYLRQTFYNIKILDAARLISNTSRIPVFNIAASNCLEDFEAYKINIASKYIIV